MMIFRSFMVTLSTSMQLTATAFIRLIPSRSLTALSLRARTASHTARHGRTIAGLFGMKILP